MLLLVGAGSTENITEGVVSAFVNNIKLSMLHIPKFEKAGQTSENCELGSTAASL